MPATMFICSDGERVPVIKCLIKCRQKQRCMFLPTLRAVAESLDRGLEEATVTELITGVRETYLKKATDYAVDPQSILYSLHGQGVHAVHEGHTEGEILGEIRLEDKFTSGKFDLYGKIIDEEEGVLGDLKVTSSYKIAKALGIYKVDVPTGEVYKTGLRKHSDPALAGKLPQGSRYPNGHEQEKLLPIEGRVAEETVIGILGNSMVVML